MREQSSLTRQDVGSTGDRLARDLEHFTQLVTWKVMAIMTWVWMGVVALMFLVGRLTWPPKSASGG